MRVEKNLLEDSNATLSIREDALLEEYIVEQSAIDIFVMKLQEKIQRTFLQDPVIMKKKLEEVKG